MSNTTTTTNPNHKISSKTFECFVCQKNGFQERVYLAGKDANNKTIYIEPDGVTLHQHKTKQQTVAKMPDNELVTTTMTPIVEPTKEHSKEDFIIALLLEIRTKIDKLIEQKHNDEDHNNPATLLDNR